MTRRIIDPGPPRFKQPSYIRDVGVDVQVVQRICEASHAVGDIVNITLSFQPSTSDLSLIQRCGEENVPIPARFNVYHPPAFLVKLNPPVRPAFA